MNSIQSKIQPIQLLAEVDDLLRTMPSRTTIRNSSPENEAWLGRAIALVRLWNPQQAIFFATDVQNINGFLSQDPQHALTKVMTTLHQVRYDLLLSTTGPLTVAIDRGATFDYFDELRKVIELGKIDIFFVDPYLDAEFVSRYLTHVEQSANIRLLTNKCLATLLPAVQLIKQQHGLNIEVRSASNLHDRYLFVDKSSCYHSGASFKDGAKKAPTTLTQIVDAFNEVYGLYQNAWDNAVVH